MAESVLVRCPACGREHRYTAPTFPCACGTPLSPPVRPGAPPVEIRHRSWDDSWVRLHCPDCGRTDHWPQPEFDCPCGALVRLQVAGADGAGGNGGADCTEQANGGGPLSVPHAGAPEPAGQVPPPTGRPPFRPVTIRTARDALTAAAQYLKWLGFAGVRLAGDRTANGIDLRGDGLVAQVDPTTRPTVLREVECLWLNCAHEDAVGAFFSLAGYAHDARLRADRLGVPLFVMDLTGTPQPVNDAADELIRSGPVLRR
jgi:RNase P subunit RPR2